jgi:hypothetical protein
MATMTHNLAGVGRHLRQGPLSRLAIETAEKVVCVEGNLDTSSKGAAARRWP